MVACAAAILAMATSDRRTSPAPRATRRTSGRPVDGPISITPPVCAGPQPVCREAGNARTPVNARRHCRTDRVGSEPERSGADDTHAPTRVPPASSGHGGPASGSGWSVVGRSRVITFDAVSKVYPDGTTAVDELSLEIPTGRITVFVGPSGCGKTTSLRMINRMVEPTGGTVSIDGVDNRSVNAPTLRRGIGYVIQNAGLFPHRTIVDNVTTVPVLQGTSRRSARKAGLELLERVGLGPELADRYPAQLSGGQQQRVGVARALAADPPVMLMDEPFSAVDPVVRDRLQAEFHALQRRLGTTVVMVTHDIDEAVRLGDRIAVMRQGGFLEQHDTPAR